MEAKYDGNVESQRKDNITQLDAFLDKYDHPTVQTLVETAVKLENKEAKNVLGALGLRCVRDPKYHLGSGEKTFSLKENFSSIINALEKLGADEESKRLNKLEREIKLERDRFGDSLYESEECRSAMSPEAIQKALQRKSERGDDLTSDYLLLYENKTTRRTLTYEQQVLAVKAKKQKGIPLNATEDLLSLDPTDPNDQMDLIDLFVQFKKKGKGGIFLSLELKLKEVAAAMGADKYAEIISKVI